MATIAQTMISNAFLWMKILYFVELHWSLLGSNEQYSSIGLNNGLAPNRRQAIIGTNADAIQ